MIITCITMNHVTHIEFGLDKLRYEKQGRHPAPRELLARILHHRKVLAHEEAALLASYESE